MPLPELLFVTNPRNSDPEEDRVLSTQLGDIFTVTMVDPRQAVEALQTASRCLIRNAWPSRLFVSEFIEIKKVCTERGIKVYNPFHRHNYIEDKTYLVDLYQAGYPVIPTINQVADLPTLPVTASYVIKPLDGGSSVGVEVLSEEEVLKRDLKNYVIQPEIDLVHELSFFFIDHVFSYAMVSAGKGKRWELVEYLPSSAEIAWAKQFVDWNHLPYGLERIDACRTKEGELLLMEVESEMPMLTLLDLSEETQRRFLKQFKTSLQAHLVEESQ